MLITSSLFIDILLLTSSLVFFLYKYFTRKFDYWKKRGVVGPKPIAFIGNLWEIMQMKVSALEWLKNLCQKYEVPYFGIFIFDEPALVIKDPELIKDILITSFNNFSDRSVGNPKHDELATEMVFFQKNPKWKISRSKISPAFTSAKMKSTFCIMDMVSAEFVKYLKNHLGTIDDMRPETSKYALEVISQYIFGVESKCFDKDTSEFYNMAMEATAMNLRNIFVQLMYIFRPKWAVFLKLDFVRKDILYYFSDIFMHNLQLRESEPRLNDFIDMVNDLKKDEAYKKIGFEGKKVGSQALNLFLAGYETTSTILSFFLYEICINQEIQEKLRQEIQQTIDKHGELSYDSISDMKYLDMCISETLRKYTVLAFLDRSCKNTYKLPGTDLVLEQGLPVYISIANLHCNEMYFPEPDKYIPERFGDDCNHKANGMVYLPFGGGPRICIGERFANLSIKGAVCKLLTHFRFLPNSRTPKTIKYDAKSVFPRSVVGLPMTIQEL